MKKVIPFVLAALLMVLAISCEKEPIPPAPQELKPTLEVFKIPDGEVPYGSKITIFWKTKNVKSLKFNGILQPQSAIDSGSITFERVCSDALYTVKATNISLSTEKEIEVHVGDWTTSKFGLVSYYPWTFKQFRIILAKDSSVVYREEPTDEEKAKVFWYHKNGELVTNFATTRKWSISEDGKNMTRGNITESFSVNGSDDNSELSFYQETTWYGEKAYFLNVFKHASTIPTDK